MLSRLKKQLNKLRKAKLSRKVVYPAAFVFLVFLFLVLIPVIYSAIFWGKIFPGTKIAGLSVGGLTQQKAIKKIENNFTFPDKIYLVSGNQEFQIESDTIELKYDVKTSVDKAYYLYRTGDFLYDTKGRLLSYFNKPNISFRYSINEKRFNENLSIINGQVSIEEIQPSIATQNEEVVVNKGQKGKIVEIDKLKDRIINSISLAKNHPIEIPTKEVDPTITDIEAQKLKSIAKLLTEKNISLEIENNTFDIQGEKLLNLLAVEGINNKSLNNLIGDIVKVVNREPQNANFKFEGGKVQEFTPAKEGLVVNKELLKNNIVQTIQLLKDTSDKTVSIEIPVETAQPEITTQEVNNLGINTLLGRGTSTFTGSIPGRIHNIDLASSKFDGVLVKPGEVFSFNKTVGDVSAYTGYKQAYVIKDGQTVLGDGGGVCQVSTTLFRAVLDAGLPIVERRAHSYRVGYYEQDSPPGLDATVYAPYTDLKFKNDTPGHLLVQTVVDARNATLAFEIYGTDDGRIAETTKPVITSQAPPPEDQFIDDPTLPQGQIKQIDYAAWGARVVFDYTVTKNGETVHEKTFYSNYQPWQAKFLRGTGPI